MEDTQTFQDFGNETDDYIDSLDLKDFQDWLASKDLKEKTIKEYSKYFGKFNYPRIDQESVNKFITKDYKHNGVARAFMKIFIEYLRTHRLELKIPGNKIVELSQIIFTRATGRTKIKIPEHLTELTEEDILKIARVMKKEKKWRNLIMLLVQYYCALRVGELMGIRISNINITRWEKNENNLGEILVHGKGDKERIAVVPNWLMSDLRDYINDINDKEGIQHKKLNELRRKDPITQESIEPFLFDITYVYWEEILRNYSKKVLGFPIKTHLLRHLRATHLHRDGHMDIMLIKEYLGHSSIQSTQIYVSVGKEELKAGAMKAALAMQKGSNDDSNEQDEEEQSD